ncbi:hypothetical protein SNOG_03462 [Parastagonospora nodorum SN15]|uniref:Uncharacterized protein n=1 Tax=Phaeosphaeria nodorum (strain SN15 / ATCC MYA-4574 / FGSC 10173) TaxID=321614 RepID=Q0UXQ2_PHANO|nr:hypothetical protein SNOG_03462 [Parastagonospora nodorum SN15]EAT88667.1 hypothetical protein SNOG_03462 [Parastagonospora nodorum SN15]
MASAIRSCRLPRHSLLHDHYRSTPHQPLQQSIRQSTHAMLHYNTFEYPNLQTRNDLGITKAHTQACMQELRTQIRGFEDKVEALQGDVRNLNIDVAVMKERSICRECPWIYTTVASL